MLRIAVYLILALAIVGVAGKHYIEVNHARKLSATTISDVDLTRVANGTYTGSYEVFPVFAEVRVEVQNQKITRVDLLKHRHGQGAAAEAITHAVLISQTPKVDAISGATISSKVIQKAIELALKSGIR